MNLYDFWAKEKVMIDASKRDPQKEALLKAQIMGALSAASVPALFMKDKGVYAAMLAIQGIVAQNMDTVFEAYYSTK